jgi:hypothetical protein
MRSPSYSSIGIMRPRSRPKKRALVCSRPDYTTTEHAERAGVRGKVLDWLRSNGPATKTDMKKVGLAQWAAIEAALDLLMKDGKVDSAPGRKAGSLRYFVTGEPSTVNSDGSGNGEG